MIFRSFTAMLFTAAISLSSTVAYAAQSHWEYKIVDGKPYAYQLGSFGETLAGFTVSFSCLTNKKVVFGLHSKYVDFGPAGSLVKFLYSVDGARAHVLAMASVSGIALAADVMPFAKTTLGGSLMVIGVTLENGLNLHSILSMTGSDSAIKRVFADCGQNLTK